MRASEILEACVYGVDGHVCFAMRADKMEDWRAPASFWRRGEGTPSA